MANIKNATKKLKQISDAGKKAEIYYILPRIESAWKFVQKRALKTGRDVPLDVFIDKHLGALNTIKKLVKKGYPVYLKDTRNVWTKTEAKYMPFEDNRKVIIDKLSKIRYDKNELERRLKNVKLSEKTRRKVLVEMENERRRIQKGSRGVKQTGENSGSGKIKHQVAGRRRTDLKSAKTGSVELSKTYNILLLVKK